MAMHAHTCVWGGGQRERVNVSVLGEGGAERSTSPKCV